MTRQLPSAVQACELHQSHSPRHLTTEFHHIVPVAWQLYTPLGPSITPPAPGRDTDGRGQLWDARGVWLCPTGHRNVHAWIVLLMHAIHDSGKDDASAAVAKVRPRVEPREFQYAVDALTRYFPYGSMLALTANGEWGQS